MSFEWNLSDVEDEEDEVDWTKDWGDGHRTTGFDAAEDPLNDWTRRPTRGGEGDDEDGNPSSRSGEESSAEDEGVDWEDGGGSNLDDQDDDRKPAARATAPPVEADASSTGPSLVPVTIDLDAEPPDSTGNSRAPHRKRHHRKRRLQLDPEAQSLVQNLSRAHLLTLVSRATYLSGVAADETLMAVLLSCVPEEGTVQSSSSNQLHPRLDDVRTLVDWFARWQVQRQERVRANRRAGAPIPNNRLTALRRQQPSKRRRPKPTSQPRSSETSDDAAPIRAARLAALTAHWSDPDPQLEDEGDLEESEGGPHVASRAERVVLFVALARSLGWRTRLVQAANPLPPVGRPGASLDIHHPLFTTHCHQLVRIVLGASGGTNSSRKRSSSPAKKSTKSNQGIRVVSPDETPAALPAPPSRSLPPDTAMIWAEILCDVSPGPMGGSTATPDRAQRRWTHVDPLNRLINRPDLVESLVEAHALPPPQAPKPLVSAPGGCWGGGGGCARRRRLQAASPPPPIKSSAKKRRPPPAVAYVVAVEHATPELHRITDVTPRYARSWTACLGARMGGEGGATVRKRPAATIMAAASPDTDWWITTLLRINHPEAVSPHPSSAGKSATKECTSVSCSGKSSGDAIVLDGEPDRENAHPPKDEPPRATQLPPTHPLDDAQEAQELQQSSKSNEVMPTSKAAFAHHPLYVIPSVMGQAEVLEPGAKKRICGLFKGECVYPRDCVSTARPAHKWLYFGRCIRDGEVGNPVKRVKARKRPATKNFRPLSSYGVGAGNDGSLEQRASEIAKGSTPLLEPDGMQDLYGIWQTDPWAPPRVEPEDPLPIHPIHKNIELDLLNPGLAHIDRPGMAPVAKQLGIPYAPCLVGFEGRGGSRTPSIRGIVVHEHHAPLLRDAGAEVAHRAVQEEHETRQAAVNRRWKKLMRGLLVQDRIEREYGDGSQASARMKS